MPTLQSGHTHTHTVVHRVHTHSLTSHGHTLTQHVHECSVGPSTTSWHFTSIFSGHSLTLFCSTHTQHTHTSCTPVAILTVLSHTEATPLDRIATANIRCRKCTAVVRVYQLVQNRNFLHIQPPVASIVATGLCVCECVSVCV